MKNKSKTLFDNITVGVTELFRNQGTSDEEEENNG